MQYCLEPERTRLFSACTYARGSGTPAMREPRDRGKPIYHGRGLLPAALTRHTWVLSHLSLLAKGEKNGTTSVRHSGNLGVSIILMIGPEWLTNAGVDRSFVEQQPHGMLRGEPLGTWTWTVQR
jgi:hypothetical protein